MSKPSHMMMLLALGLHAQMMVNDATEPRLPFYTDIEPKEKKPKWPFTEEELAQLAQLEGKEKKAFLKTLKKRYGA